MHDQHHGPRGEAGNRRQVARLIVRQVPHQDRVRHEARLDEQHRVPVRRRFRHERGADRAVRAGAVLHHHRLIETVLELLRQGACNHVRGTPGLKRHHDAQRPARVALRVNRSRTEDEHQLDRNKDPRYPPLAHSPLIYLPSVPIARR